MAEPDATPAGPSPPVSPRQFLGLLLLAAAVGLAVSLAAWCFLQLMHYVPEWVYDDLPDALGYEDGAPQWWPLPALAVRGLSIGSVLSRRRGLASTRCYGFRPARALSARPYGL